MKSHFSKLGFRLLFNAITFGAILCAAISFIGYRHFKYVFEEQYNKTTLEFAYIASNSIDGDKIDDYMASVFPDDNWQAVQSSLNELVNIADLDSLSLTVPDTVKYSLQVYVHHCVNARFSDKQTVFPLGAPELLSGKEKQYIIHLKKLMLLGRHFTEYTYTDTGGYVTTSVPIRDSYNDIVAMLSVVKSMDEVLVLQTQYQHLVFLISIVIAVVFLVLYGLSLLLTIIRPVSIITQETDFFAQHGKLSGIIEKIRNKDEIGVLAKSVQKMSEDINKYIGELTTVTAEKERISTELSLGTKIQSDMLPKAYPAFPARTDFDLFASMDPAKEVGGDLYDYMLLDDDHLMLVVGDVSGKGVPAALFMVVAKTVLDAHATKMVSPAEIFEVTNNQLCHGNETGLFVTCWLGILTFSTGELRFVNAGHPCPVLYHKGEFSYIVTKPNFVLGGMEGLPYTEHTVMLERGDRIFIYTDGVTEATDANKVLFGEDRLLEAMKGTENLSAPDTLVAVRQKIDAFVGEAEQFDDITMLDFIWK